MKRTNTNAPPHFFSQFQLALKHFRVYAGILIPPAGSQCRSQGMACYVCHLHHLPLTRLMFYFPWKYCDVFRLFPLLAWCWLFWLCN